MPATSTKHKCPKLGCSKMVPQYMLACKAHWFELPAPLREAINYTWRNDRDAHAANVRQAYELLGK